MSASPAAGNVADIQGARLYYQIAGDGRTLVMVHAGIADSSMWDDQWDVFSRDLRVMRYDLRGLGRSTIPPQTFSHHDDLAALLEFLDIPSCVLLGASYGGNVATEFTLEHPEAVDALVLVNSLVGMSEPSAGFRAGWDATEVHVEAGDLDAGVEVELRMWVDGPHRTLEQVDETVRDRVRVMNTALFHRVDEQEVADEQELEPPAIERLAEIAVPALVISGELDQPDALASADAIAEAIAGARRVSMSDAAHLPSMERPDEFNRIVLDFIRSL